MQKRVMCVVGTRPEAIKMAPVILALRNQDWAATHVVATAQHREMLDQTLSAFGVVPDRDLNLMKPNQTLSELNARALTAIDDEIVRAQPDFLLAQGDTTTVLAAATAAFYRRIPFGHVEAGLRTFDLDNPFPEEFNRVVTSRIARLHFAPTESARQNLLSEGVDEGRIFVTGNTVIDSLLHTSAKTERTPNADLPQRKLILVTVHRRENFGQPIGDICTAIETIVDTNPDVEVLWPVHPNPNVTEIVRGRFGGKERVRLVDPLGYVAFVEASNAAYLILTDSGGVQEEAPALAKPVLVLRQATERPEAVEAGVARLIGTDTRAIVAETDQLLHDRSHYETMARGGSPYGDGKASARIVEAVRDLLIGSARGGERPEGHL